MRAAIEAVPAIHPRLLEWAPYVRRTTDDDASEDVSDVLVLGTQLRIFFSLTPTGRTLVPEPVKWLEALAAALGVDGEVVRSTPEARVEELAAALGQCVSVVLDAKLSQLMAATLVVIDVVQGSKK
ncbi:MAG: hypothetical protein JST54_22505 [Deltaproteobacteria bacterium]|nr:hypothetical protein [Deltaproteobacteria bacterium]